MTDILAIIPARGGSKGIANKNIRPVGGQPLMAWTIQAARSAASLSRIVVSTDSAAIAEVAQHYGAEVPFMRPAELAQDTTPGMDPILHAMNWLSEHDRYTADWVICLQPTSPLRTADDIDAAVQLVLEKRGEAVVSVTDVAQHPYWMKQVDDDGRLFEFMTGMAVTRRQDLPPLYGLNGAIYLARRDLLLQRRTWYGDQTYAYIMPAERSIDVDSPWDLHLVDLILTQQRGQM